MANNPSKTLLIVPAVGIVLLAGIGLVALWPHDEPAAPSPAEASTPPVAPTKPAEEPASDHLPPPSAPKPSKPTSPKRPEGHRPAPPSAPGVRADPGDADVGRAIGDIRNAVNDCLQEGLKRSPSFAGKILVMFTLDSGT